MAPGGSIRKGPLKLGGLKKGGQSDTLPSSVPRAAGRVCTVGTQTRPRPGANGLRMRSGPAQEVGDRGRTLPAGGAHSVGQRALADSGGRSGCARVCGLAPTCVCASSVHPVSDFSV